MRGLLEAGQDSRRCVPQKLDLSHELRRWRRRTPDGFMSYKPQDLPRVRLSLLTYRGSPGTRDPDTSSDMKNEKSCELPSPPAQESVSTRYRHRRRSTYSALLRARHFASIYVSSGVSGFLGSLVSCSVCWGQTTISYKMTPLNVYLRTRNRRRYVHLETWTMGVLVPNISYPFPIHTGHVLLLSDGRSSPFLRRT